MSIRRARSVVFAAVTLLAGCQHVSTSAISDAGSDADNDADSDSDGDGDTETDSVPWSTPEDAGVLFSVWGSGPDDVYAGGEGQTLLHGSGTTWELLPLPEEFVASDIHGSAWESFYIAAGWNGEADCRILRYDGAAWSDILPECGGEGSQALWVFGIDDLFSVSTWVNPMEPGYYGTAVAHFDGTVWSGVWNDGFLSDDAGHRYFEDMAGTEDRHVFVVGVIQVGNPVAVVSDGVTWWIEELPASALHGVWALDAANVWAVGDGGAHHPLRRRGVDGRLRRVSDETIPIRGR